MKFVAKSQPGIAGAALLVIIAITGVGAGAQADQACPGGKVKYYRNPMGTPDTSPVPKKDSMNMDYLPVCEDAAGDGPGTVKLSLDKVQRLGVRSEAVAERPLSRVVRAFATLQFDERRQAVIAPKFGGWIEKLYVNATGDVVTVGQKLFDVYSPELNVLQQQWRLGGRSADATDKLRYLAYPETALEKLRQGDP
ncbi:MAG TPA: efflux RND transporter periplasmic adaptor subunit, partial [Reyranella sp.]